MKLSLWHAILLTGTVFGVTEARSSDSGIPAPPPIPAFREVTPDIFRGARPDPAGLQALVKQGIKTDLDLEDNAPAEIAESAVAKGLGLQFISKKMSSTLSPGDAEVDEILAILENQSNYPIFVHCKLGEDRTGLIVALYRVLDQKWSAPDAYNEWVQDGFHVHLTGLKDYFTARTGYTP